MESWKPQQFVPLNNSERERQLKEIYDRSQREVEYLQCKRKLAEAELEIAVLKKGKKSLEAHTEIEKVERQRVEWILTHGGQIKEWSENVIRLQDRLRTIDKEQDQLQSIKDAFSAKRIPGNLPRYLKHLETSTLCHIQICSHR